MVIYGTALLAICLLLGVAAGTLLGDLLGVNADIGGVGLAMILLIFATHRLRCAGRLPPLTESGITFWGAIYVPIVVAMTAGQNVMGALNGGMVALLAGTGTVVICFGLVRILGQTRTPQAEDRGEVP
jgi:malonate transporter MadL subunit